MDVIVLKGIKFMVPTIPIILFASEKEEEIKHQIYIASFLTVVSVNIYNYIVQFIDDYEEDIEYDHQYN